MEKAKVMSILSLIKDPIPFIALGGRSGIGKTSILNYLLTSYPQNFKQPKSYTDRERRGRAERYEFVSTDSIKKMFQNGELLNLDDVYGNLYGIELNAILNIQKEGLIPIKEIHPKNFYKFKQSDISTVTVLIENKDFKTHSSSFLTREGRESEDLSFEENTSYDIVLNVSGLSVRDAASYLIKKLFAYKSQTQKGISTTTVDSLNLKGYNSIAAEFLDSKRITTKNFHDATKSFWSSVFSRTPRSGLKVLELGVGNGWLFDNFSKFLDHNNVYGVDLSKEMKPTYCDEVFYTSARSIPVPSESFDLVVASLGDPFLYPESLVEVERVLRVGGKFILSSPSLTWAMGLPSRTRKNITTFESDDGTRSEVFSFCNIYGVLSDVSLYSSLRVVRFEEMYLPNDYNERISDAITSSAKSLNRRVSDLPIATGIILNKA